MKSKHYIKQNELFDINGGDYIYRDIWLESGDGSVKYYQQFHRASFSEVEEITESNEIANLKFYFECSRKYS